MRTVVRNCDMVYPFETGITSCTVHDTMPSSTQKKISFVVRPSKTVNEVFSEVATQFPYANFELVLQSTNQDQAIFLNDKKDQILDQIPGFISGAKNTLVLMPPGSWENNPKKKIDLDTTLSPATPDPDPMSDDDLALGASASPTEPDSTSNIPTAPALPNFHKLSYTPSARHMRIFSQSPPRSRSTSTGYVGLVNQAMTCYLNSLLQALFMTPEFRNALYKRKFDNINEERCIPFELQKLFLNLQTSSKVAVETIDLTASFGWRSTEAWQQHDIQELCRVMFDALECKFKGTDQENLINNLYEGKMIDYVKCLECCIEKSREDTYLDIPLPVRPFGSSTAYGSVEEALRAFVQPEILDLNNQYFCEKCNKKCDAHKGLKFKTFPYILTLHLKRFDFDYQTLHRIKLNDKVTFPQTLNLNSFVNTTDAGTFINLQNNHGQINGFVNSASSEHENTDGIVKYDDCSTTDSGAALEEDNCSGIATTASSSHHENEFQEDDEGIDLGSNAENRINHSNESGPYIYELFAIMIHSGSASGGHYYVYIKEFENGEWYCFNDQTVTSITQEDIQKSFGGGSFKAYYSGVYSSSTNAYMLMYRQIDPNRNERPMKADEFPEHIHKLLKDMQEKEHEDRKSRPSENIKPKVFFYNPKLKQMKETRVYISKTSTLETVLEFAAGLFDVREFAPITRCRLVAYDYQNEQIYCSLEGQENDSIDEVLNSITSDIGFLLEIRDEGEEFEKYSPGGITAQVYKIDLKTSDLDGPYLARFKVFESASNIKKAVAKKLHINEKNLIIVDYGSTKIHCIDDNENAQYSVTKLFVAETKGPKKEAEETLKKIVQENLTSLMYLFLTVPNVNKYPYILEFHEIPKYEPKSESLGDSNYETPKQSPSDGKQSENSDVVDAVILNGFTTGDQGASGDFKRTSPLPLICPYTGHESNSEDSSLSDGDRTLVESAPHDSSQVSSTSHSPQLSSPEDENGEKHNCRPILANDSNSEDEDDIEFDNGLYFRAVEITEKDMSSSLIVNGNHSDSEDNKDRGIKSVTYKIYLDKRMKLGSFKRVLEPLIGVPVDYFKIGFLRKQSDRLKSEYTTSIPDNLNSLKNGEQLKVELGRNLKKGECRAKIYYLKLSELNNEVGKLSDVCEWIFKIGMPVIDAKREIIDKLQKTCSKYEKLNLKNCRLWEKSGANPIRILRDNQQLDFRLSANCEIIIQECEDGVNVTTSEDSRTLFVRRWYPSTLELGEFQEITLERNSDIRKVLASMSDIPEEKIAFIKVNSSFPCTNISIININSSTNWFTTSTTLDNYPLSSSDQDGAVCFYKNSDEQPKELTTEERRELNQKEKVRLERVGGASTTLYSPRKEKALKIYLYK